MNNYFIEKYHGFSKCEEALEKMAKKGFLPCGITWDTPLAVDVFTVTFKKANPVDVVFRIKKFIHSKLADCEKEMNEYDDSWELVTSSYSVTAIKHIIIGLFMKRITK